MKKQNKFLWILWIIVIISIISIFFTNIYTYKKTKFLFEDKLTLLPLQIQEKEDPNCPKEEGKLCDTRQKVITSYKNICEKKELLSNMGTDYIADLTRCFINGVYCEKIEGFMCHKNSQQKIWYGDTCKKSNLEKLGYTECLK